MCLILKNVIEKQEKTKRVNEIKHLIISSTIDFSTDLVCIELEKRGHAFLRINRDRLSEYNICYDIGRNTLEVNIDGINYYCSNEMIKAIYFRAPVFLRSNKQYSVDEQLSRSQWNAFLRNMIVFDLPKWINSPYYTYKAENKIYQLKMASEVGLQIPVTRVCNHCPNDIIDDDEFIVKAIDTPLFYEKNEELFTYSNIVSGNELKQASLNDAPIILQECIKNKVDLRITIVGNKIFPVEIKSNGQGITGDWRKKKKEELEYISTTLPREIVSMLFSLMKRMNLCFGGVDMAFVNGEYYFIEINPTGEWGWLTMNPGLQIQEAIVDTMER